MANLKALLHHETLLEAYKQSSAETGKPLFDRYFKNPRKALTDDASVLVSPAQNKAAPFNTRGAPARVLDPLGKSKRQGAMFHTFNQMRLSPQVFQGLREPDSETIFEIATGEIDDQMSQFARRHVVQKELVMAKVLTKGAVIADVNGVIKETAATGDETYDFGIAAGHKDQLGGLIDVTWANTAADPEKQFENIKESARSANVPEPTLVIANSKIKQRIRLMTKFTTLAAASPMTSEKLLNGSWVENLFGMTWLFIDGMYEDSTGTMTKYIPDDLCVLLPQENTGWLRCMEGLELVPTDINIGSTMQDKVNSLAKVYGDYAYASLEHNPVGLNAYFGSHFGFVVAEPNAIWQADVVFG
jgi:hypothetical protein